MGAMMAEVKETATLHVEPTEDLELLIIERTDIDGQKFSLTLTLNDALHLAQGLPHHVDQIAAKKGEQVSRQDPDMRAHYYFPIVQTEMNVDLHNSKVLLSLTDDIGHTSRFEFRPGLAKTLAQGFARYAEEIESEPKTTH